MKKSILLISFLTLSFINNLSAQLKFKNSETVPIYIAVAYKVESNDYTGYTSEGWFKVEPNSTITIFPNIKNATYYYYAKDDNGGEWAGKGKYKFVVHSQHKFEFRNGDMAYNEKYLEHQVYKNFRKIDIGQVKEYTINLTDTEE